jgi:hypothetical protein
MLFCIGLKYSILFWEQDAEDNFQMIEEVSYKRKEKTAK